MIWWIVKIVSGGAPIAWLWWVITHDADGTLIGAIGWTLRLVGGAVAGVAVVVTVGVFGQRSLAARMRQRHGDVADAAAGRRAPASADVES